MSRPLLVQALAREPIPRFPVWLMRQAGRYLPEYRALKAKHSFLELCRTPELALEVSLQPLRAFPIDAAIVFSDILLPTEALGIEIDFAPGPVVKNPIRRNSDIGSLRLDERSESLSATPKTIRLIRTALSDEASPRRAVIGFAGAPWTLACYLIDQGPYKHFHGAQVFINTRPREAEKLLTCLTDLVIVYLRNQIESGADAVQVFDSWGGNLNEEDYRRWSLPYLQRIFAAISDVPSILYVNSSTHLLSQMAESGAACLSVDWRTPLAVAESAAGHLGVQGNLDPACLFGSQETVRNVTQAMLGSLNRKTGYVANLGHGVLVESPRESVAAFVETIQRHRL